MISVAACYKHFVGVLEEKFERKMSPANLTRGRKANIAVYVTASCDLAARAWAHQYQFEGSCAFASTDKYYDDSFGADFGFQTGAQIWITNYGKKNVDWHFMVKINTDGESPAQRFCQSEMSANDSWCNCNDFLNAKKCGAPETLPPGVWNGLVIEPKWECCKKVCCQQSMDACQKCAYGPVQWAYDAGDVVDPLCGNWCLSTPGAPDVPLVQWNTVKGVELRIVDGSGIRFLCDIES